MAARVAAGLFGGVLSALAQTIVVDANHQRAFAFSALLVFTGFTMLPYLTIYLQGHVGLRPDQIPCLYLAGGVATLFTARLIGRLSDRLGKQRLFRALALAVIALMPATTLLPPWPLWAMLVVSTALFICMSGRMIPGMALVTGATAPAQRGTFMALNPRCSRSPWGWHRSWAASSSAARPPGWRRTTGAARWWGWWPVFWPWCWCGACMCTPRRGCNGSCLNAKVCVFVLCCTAGLRAPSFMGIVGSRLPRGRRAVCPSGGLCQPGATGGSCMNLTISGHHLEVTPALRGYVTTKLERISRHFDQVVDIKVLLTVDNLKEKDQRQKAECNIHVKGRDLFAECAHSDLYAAVDELADKLDRQVLRYKDKTQEHHHDTAKRLM